MKVASCALFVFYFWGIAHGMLEKDGLSTLSLTNERGALCKCKKEPVFCKKLLPSMTYRSKYGILEIGEVVWPSSLESKSLEMLELLLAIASTSDIAEKYRIVSQVFSQNDKCLVVSASSAEKEFLACLRNIIRLHLLECLPIDSSQLPKNCLRVASYLCYTNFSKYLKNNRLLGYTTEKNDGIPLSYLNIFGMGGIKMQCLHYWRLMYRDPQNFSEIYRPTIEAIATYGAPRDHILSWAIRSSIIDSNLSSLNENTAPALMFLE